MVKSIPFGVNGAVWMGLVVVLLNVAAWEPVQRAWRDGFHFQYREINGNDGWGTIAFEDKYPEVNDRDFNDLVVNVRITEVLNFRGQLTRIHLVFYPKVHSGGYNHALIISFSGHPEHLSYESKPMFNGEAAIRYVLYGSSGQVLEESEISDPSRDFTIFQDTGQVFPNKTNADGTCTIDRPTQYAEMDIVLREPELNRLGTGQWVDLNRYRIYLHVLRTDQYVDLVELNPHFIANDGTPFGFFVPVNWRYPRERVSAFSIYPDFQLHRDFLRNWNRMAGVVESQASRDWYRIVDPRAEDKLAKCRIAMPKGRPLQSLD